MFLTMDVACFLRFYPISSCFAWFSSWTNIHCSLFDCSSPARSQHKGAPLPVLSGPDPVDRPVTFQPTKAPYDPRLLLTGRPNPGQCQSRTLESRSWARHVRVGMRLTCVSSIEFSSSGRRFLDSFLMLIGAYFFP